MSRKISVIIPCYNLEKDISRCLDSMIGQTYKNLEIIVVDDGSKDNSVDVIKGYCGQDTRVKCLQQENQGPSTARNNGIDVATGDYIMFVDGDDYIGKTYIEDLENSIVDGCDMVIAGLRYLYPDGTANIVDGVELCCHKEEFLSTYYAKCIQKRLIFGPYNKLYKKSMLDEFGIRFDKSIEIREDGLFVLDVIKKADTFNGIRNSEYYYVQHGLNDSLITKFHASETSINKRFFREMVSVYGDRVLTKEEIECIYPMYLNMDVSSIRKYFKSKKPSYMEAMKYILEILNNDTFKTARRELFAVNKKLALKYYRPAILVYIINKRAVKNL